MVIKKGKNMINYIVLTKSYKYEFETRQEALKKATALEFIGSAVSLFLIQSKGMLLIHETKGE